MCVWRLAFVRRTLKVGPQPTGHIKRLHCREQPLMLFRGIIYVCWRTIILYVLFWVFPRCTIVVCRRFGTLYQFHLQGLDVEYEVSETDRGFRNVGKQQSDAGEIPKRIYIQYSKHGEILKSRTIILPVVLYGCETWSLTLREERKLRVFENMVLRRIFGPRRDEVTGNGGDCITRSLMICTAHPILFGW